MERVTNGLEFLRWWSAILLEKQHKIPFAQAFCAKILLQNSLNKTKQNHTKLNKTTLNRTKQNKTKLQFKAVSPTIRKSFTVKNNITSNHTTTPTPHYTTAKYPDNSKIKHNPRNKPNKTEKTVNI